MFVNPYIGFKIAILAELKVVGTTTATPYLMSSGYDNAHLN